MIPSYNASGVLPPYTGSDATVPTFVSPYKATILEFTTRFATSMERRAILRGLLGYRAALMALGIFDGYQWLDGSFCSDIEALEARPPGDIDVVTYARRPTAVADDTKFKAFLASNVPLFDPRVTKVTYKVDAYFTDMDMKPHILVERASYWHGVFGHQRVTSLWKGMVRVELSCNDAAAVQYLDDLDAQHLAAAGAASASDPLTVKGACDA